MGKKTNRIVVKVGTSTLTNELGNSNLHRIEALCMALADLQNMGNEIILVSSGAIAVGANKMHLPEKPKEPLTTISLSPVRMNSPLRVIIFACKGLMF